MKRSLPMLAIFAVAALTMIGVGYLFRPTIDSPYEIAPGSKHSSVADPGESLPLLEKQLGELDKEIADLAAKGNDPDQLARDRLLRKKLQVRIDALRRDAGP